MIYVLVPLLMLGDSCGYEDHCQDDNAVCDVDGFCSCVGGYRPVFGKCGKLEKNIGQNLDKKKRISQDI